MPPTKPQAPADLKRDVLLRLWDRHLAGLSCDPDDARLPSTRLALLSAGRGEPLAPPRIMRQAPRPDVVVDLFAQPPDRDVSLPLALCGAVAVVLCALAIAALVLWS